MDSSIEILQGQVWIFVENMRNEKQLSKLFMRASHLPFPEIEVRKPLYDAFDFFESRYFCEGSEYLDMKICEFAVMLEEALDKIVCDSKSASTPEEKECLALEEKHMRVLVTNFSDTAKKLYEEYKP